MHFVDTHCHLDSILKKSKSESYSHFKSTHLGPDYEKAITISCDVHSIEPVLELTQYPEVYAAYGLHPHDSSGWDISFESRLYAALKHEKCVGFGEMGLDYHYDFSPRETQREIFIRQLQTLAEVKKTLVIHTREAEADTLAIMRDYVPKDWPIHVHCFTSSPGFAETLLADFSALMLGFTGIVTFKTAGDVRDVVRLTPMNRFLLETDGPYLAPEPFRGKVAHPGHIPLIAKALAGIKACEADEVLIAARNNTRIIYGI